ncbi:MAG: hypothetical protein LBQ66_16685 [Planctomycetaceae bacterium]|jgi:hypothetical protein|nr:hypothetical protein [Planctomycetaceae bacterium]
MNITIREFLDQYKLSQNNNDKFEHLINDVWCDWFCDDSKLPKKTVKLIKYLKSLITSKKININTMYVFFKNNCPLDGSLYDDFRICDIETGNVIYTITPRNGHRSIRGQSTVWGCDNDFKEAIVTGTWNDVKRFFDVKIKTKNVVKRKPRAKLIGADSNIFNLISIASDALKSNQQDDDAKEMITNATKAKSFDEALAIIMEYVDVR